MRSDEMLMALLRARDAGERRQATNHEETTMAKKTKAKKVTQAEAKALVAQVQAKPMTKAEAKKALAKLRAKHADEAEGQVTPLRADMPVTDAQRKGKAGKAKKTEDLRDRFDLTKLKAGDKLGILEGTRCEWLKAGTCVEFRGIERKTLARIKYVDGKGKSHYTLIGSRNLQRAK